VVLHLEGARLVVEEDTRELHDAVRTLAHRADGSGVVLDLGKVGQLDCSGIGQLVQLRGEVAGSGGVLCLVNVAPRPKRLLSMLQLLGVLPVFASEAEAVTACWSARARDGAGRSPRIEAPPLAPRPAVQGVLRAAV
jgi:anti-anti-sigma factor